MYTNCTILGVHVSCSPAKVTLAPWTLRLLGQVEGQNLTHLENHLLVRTILVCFTNHFVTDLWPHVVLVFHWVYSHAKKSCSALLNLFLIINRINYFLINKTKAGCTCMQATR